MYTYAENFRGKSFGISNVSMSFAAFPTGVQKYCKIASVCVILFYIHKRAQRAKRRVGGRRLKSIIWRIGRISQCRKHDILYKQYKCIHTLTKRSKRHRPRVPSARNSAAHICFVNTAFLPKSVYTSTLFTDVIDARGAKQQTCRKQQQGSVHGPPDVDRNTIDTRAAV